MLPLTTGHLSDKDKNRRGVPISERPLYTISRIDIPAIVLDYETKISSNRSVHVLVYDHNVKALGKPHIIR